MLDFFPVFASPFFKGRVEVPWDAVAYWMNESHTKETTQVSNRDGWQSESFRTHPQTKTLEEFLQRALPAFKQLDMWVNVNRKGSFNVQHMHPGNDLAFVWYLTDASGLQLQNPNIFQQFHILKEFDHDHGSVYEAINFTNAAGDVLIFPAHINHKVLPTEEDIRISVAGNLRWTPQEVAPSTFDS